MIPFSSLRNAFIFLCLVVVVFLGLMRLSEPPKKTNPPVVVPKTATKVDYAETFDSNEQPTLDEKVDATVDELYSLGHMGNESPSAVSERKDELSAWRKNNAETWKDIGFNLRTCATARFLRGLAQTPDIAIDECMDADYSLSGGQ